MTSEVILASQLQEKVIARIADLRGPEVMPKYRKDLAKYKRRLGKRQEGMIVQKNGFFESKKLGFLVEVYGQQVPVYRPEEPNPLAWSYTKYERFMGSAMHAKQYGLLADPQLNRDIRPGRVEEYGEEMEAGRWHDLLSDPIAITEDGHVVNGQHRLAAASGVCWEKVENDPAFLVIWGVSPTEALLADGSRRTDRDEHTIATRVANAALNWTARLQKAKAHAEG
jgi:hypothetical protein